VPIRVVLADNQVIFRAGAARVLATEEDVRIVAQCDDRDRLLHIAATMRGSILLVAQSLAGDLEQLASVVRAAGSRTILLTEREEALSPTQSTLIDGLICRHTNSDKLVECVRRVSRGERCVETSGKSTQTTDSVGARVRERLTHRELQIIGYIVRGCKNREIAEELGTKEQVIKNYLRGIYDKTGVSDRLELALFTLHHRVLAEAAATASDPALHMQAPLFRGTATA